MQHRSLVLRITVLVIGLVTLTLFALSSLQAAGAPVAARSLSAAPQRPVTDTIPMPNTPTDLVFGTYLYGDPPSFEGLSYEIGGIGLDDAGNIYVAGVTDDPNFPVTAGLENTFRAANNIFVAKFSPDGATLVYSTLVGPAIPEASWEGKFFGSGLSLAVDSAGAVYLTGKALYPDFPVTPGAYATTCNASCVFVTRLDPDGRIGYSTFLGGTSRQGEAQPTNSTGIAVDAAGNIYVGGYTGAHDFPTTVGAFQSTLAVFDGFLVELHPSGAGASDLVYGTYFGSSGQEVITAITVDTQGIIYATGWTANNFVDGATTLFPTTPNAYDTDPPHVPADVDAFVLRLNPSGNGAADLLYSTYLGTEASYPISDQDRGTAIAVDATGAVFVLGATASSAFPTTLGAYRPTGAVSHYEANIFLAKLRPSGNGAADLIYATYVAKGYDNEFDDHEYSWRTLAVDDLGDVYTGGAIAVDEQLATTPGAFNAEFGNSIVVRLRLAGQGDKDLIYGTYLGSFVRALTVAETGQIALSGITNECDFATTTDAWQPECAAGWIATVAGLRTPERSLATGRAIDPNGASIMNTPIVAGGIYTAFTDREGVFSLMLPPGEQTLTPIQRDFAWDPPQRTVTVPPAASGQDFVGYRIVQKTVQPDVRLPVAFGDTITYTLHLRGPGFADAILADPVPTYTLFLSETLQSLPGIVYHAESNTLSGTLPLAPMASGVITFAVRVAVTGTVESGPVIVNQAQVYPAAAPEQAIWSEPVFHFTYLWSTYVPLSLLQEEPAP